MRSLYVAGRRRIYLLIYRMICICSALAVFVANAEDATSTLPGEKTFLKFCAGCHGFDGFAAYEHAPSFSMGERMQKDDRELLQSVLNGKNNMPPWQDKLPVSDLRDAITYIRTMHERSTKGKLQQQGPPDDTYYLFKPVGETNMDWVNRKKEK